MQTITAILAVLSLWGAVQNARSRWICFPFWMVANAGWALVALAAGLPFQAVMFSAYFFISVFGLWAWRKKYAQG